MTPEQFLLDILNRGFTVEWEDVSSDNDAFDVMYFQAPDHAQSSRHVDVCDEGVYIVPEMGKTISEHRGSVTRRYEDASLLLATEYPHVL